MKSSLQHRFGREDFRQEKRGQLGPPLSGYDAIVSADSIGQAS